VPDRTRASPDEGAGNVHRPGDAVTMNSMRLPVSFLGNAHVRKALWLVVGLVAVIGALRAQRPFRVYPALEGYDYLALPADYRNPAELILGRLIYPAGRFGRRRGGGGGGDWRTNRSMWTVDYPKGDRTYAMILRRLTRIDVRSVEQCTDPDDGDDIYYWPMIHVALPGSWSLSDAEAQKIREYLLRGGFMVGDSFFGTNEWEGFESGMKRVFPDREIIELPDDAPIFHTVYDLSKRTQVGYYGAYLAGGRGYRADGRVPHWRAVLDDRGRVMFNISFNNDMGDSWQWADEPTYPAESAHMGLRLGVNNAVYAMTH
jgi:hypothetical protein